MRILLPTVVVLFFWKFCSAITAITNSGRIGQATQKSMTVWEKETQSPPDALPKITPQERKKHPALIPALKSRSTVILSIIPVSL
jgi:hypothetical protein